MKDRSGNLPHLIQIENPDDPARSSGIFALSFVTGIILSLSVRAIRLIVTKAIRDYTFFDDLLKEKF